VPVGLCSVFCGRLHPVNGPFSSSQARLSEYALLNNASAQKVYVSSSSDDMVGQRFAFAVKEAIRKSATWELVATPATDFRVELVSIDPDQGDSSQDRRSAISITIEFEGIR
jgi:hypothetical protein